ncbi:MAG TPA: hypothetical protein VGD60_19075 [Candidatus Acidoferrales bacterium]
MKRSFRFVAAAAALASFALLAAQTRADEIKLKDGSKITGTIVGFEENSFKVKTSYGFAVVQKDQVVSITVSNDSPKKSASASEKDAAVETSAPSAPSRPAKKDAVANPPAAVSTPAPTVAAAKPAPPPPQPAPVPAPKPAAPEPMREQVVGNTYTNQTYGFQMYKPPAWKVIEGARTLLPGSITAMGNDDQTTYLLIGQEAAGKSLNTDIDATEHRLRDILDNFRPIDEKRVTISGVSAIEHHFRGSVDQKDWSGVVVYLPRDTHVYTIFGMTLADTDLVQIQENIISRAISSLQFTK